MDLLTVIVLTILVIFIAALVRSTFGFGDALLAMPLLTLLLGIHQATPIAAFVSTTIAGVILIGSWQQADLKAAWRLIVASIIGIPIGLYLLTAAPEQVVRGVVGMVLIAFGIYNLSRPRLMVLQRSRWAYLFGFVAGILGGAYNTNGPPVVIYGTLRRWSPARFRATMQGYFLPTMLLVTTGHGLSGLWSRQVWLLFAFAIPGLLAAIWLGGRLNARIPAGRFDRLIYGALILLGLLMFI